MQGQTCTVELFYSHEYLQLAYAIENLQMHRRWNTFCWLSFAKWSAGFSLSEIMFGWWICASPLQTASFHELWSTVYPMAWRDNSYKWNCRSICWPHGYAHRQDLGQTVFPQYAGVTQTKSHLPTVEFGLLFFSQHFLEFFVFKTYLITVDRFSPATSQWFSWMILITFVS